MTLSIIIPAFNAEPYLERCFDSIYRDASSMEYFEVIVVNDGSKDNTLSRLNEYQAKYRNMVVVDQPNGGVSVARNNGIISAKGDYVLFLDADDELVEGALAKVYVYLKEHDSMDMLVTRQIRKKGNKTTIIPAPTLKEHIQYNGVEAYRSHYVRTNAGGGICRTCFLREFNLFFPKGVTNGEDSVFFAHLQVYAQKIVYNNILLYQINEITGSASRNDRTSLGIKLINTLESIDSIKSQLNVSAEQRGIFDYVAYQMLSRTMNCFAESKELSYNGLKKSIRHLNLLPFDVRHMFLMREKARMINYSFAFSYFLRWLHYHIR